MYNSYRQGAIQTRDPYLQKGPYRQEALIYRHFTIPIDKWPIQTGGPFQTRDPTDAARFLQIRDPYIIYMQGCKGLLQTRAPSYKQGPLQYIQTRATYRYVGRYFLAIFKLNLSKIHFKMSQISQIVHFLKINSRGVYPLGPLPS